jgi:hypothetical protein
MISDARLLFGFSSSSNVGSSPNEPFETRKRKKKNPKKGSNTISQNI